MKLIFVRHGETSHNVKGHIHKRGDDALLTEKGKLQIMDCANVLKQQNINGLYTSPETRARESAELLAKDLAVEIQIANFEERDWGDWEGKTWNEIKETLDKLPLDERHSFVPPNGESWQQMEDRLKKALEEITRTNHPAACIVTHSGVLRALMRILKDAPLEEGIAYDFDNGSITIFEHKNGKYTELVVNDVKHLP
ncbi:hypothetical protein COV18_06550 [Candidatus Woesearchaeota archaeon CG10_big_fil_rev_8_21_14_0_10_37_12]|nr:MAG: hypothetical protein COV18_06550 [Candidatus Woesearchaeota archaeon CG10_big_fil_rev_8_21_14_0_10_37_12]